MKNQKIQKLIEDMKLVLEEDTLNEMSNFRKRITGLPVNLSLQIETDDDKKYPHNVPRLKFQNNTADRITSKADLIPISIDKENPVVLIDKPYDSIIYKQVRQWIIINYDALIQFWKQEIDEFELKDKLIQV